MSSLLFHSIQVKISQTLSKNNKTKSTFLEETDCFIVVIEISLVGLLVELMVLSLDYKR